MEQQRGWPTPLTMKLPNQADHDVRVSAGPTQDAWDTYHPMIVKLYREENYTLPKVRQMLLGQGFDVSIPMLKKRITKWGLDKNNKRDEIVYAFKALNSRRELGKQSRITIRGKRISETEINRYCRRAKLNLPDRDHDTEIPEPPKDVLVSTPSPEPSQSFAYMPASKACRGIKRKRQCSPLLSPCPKTAGQDAVNDCDNEDRRRGIFEVNAVAQVNDRAWQLAVFGSDLCSALSSDDIMACFNAEQEALVCLQICLQETRSSDVAHVSIEQINTDVVFKTFNLRVVGDNNGFWTITHAVCEYLGDLCRQINVVSISQIFLIIGILRNFEAEEELIALLLRHIYTLANELYRERHWFTIFVSKLAHVDSGDFMAQSYLDVDDWIPTDSLRLVQTKLNLYTLLLCFARLDTNLTCALSRLGQLQEQTKLDFNCRLSACAAELSAKLHRRRFSAAREVLDDLEAAYYQKFEGRPPAWCYIHVLRCRYICARAEWNRIESVKILRGTWLLARRLLTDDDFWLSIIARDSIVWGFGNPFDQNVDEWDDDCFEFVHEFMDSEQGRRLFSDSHTERDQ